MANGDPLGAFGRFLKSWPTWALLAVVLAAGSVAALFGRLDEWVLVILAVVFITALLLLLARAVHQGDNGGT